MRAPSRLRSAALCVQISERAETDGVIAFAMHSLGGLARRLASGL